jgi:hypothetical protein
MDHERTHTEDEATSVDEPNGAAPDEGRAYDPEMTDADEANIPPESEADPEG